MPAFTDQIGRTILLSAAPVRVISLVPSQTELLYTLHADVAGITKFCIRPDVWYRNKPRVGGTKNVDREKIAALCPDLIIANKEENDRDQVESLAGCYPLWVSDIHTLSDALQMIRSVGELVDRPREASAIATRILDNFSGLIPGPPVTAAYLIWRTDSPLSFMAAGGDTFIHDMLVRCGFVNPFAGHTRYPTVEPAALAACNLVLLSSEPYPFREKHQIELQALLPQAKVRLVDGQFFSWYGSRLLGAPRYFRDLLSGLP
ncbi:MAG TPA: helical backbone metal receptor [Puia sp.]|nr:helical backbone metal receptor [Puia sp.]